MKNMVHCLQDSSYESNVTLYFCKIKSEENSSVSSLKGKVSLNLIKSFDKQDTKSGPAFFLDHCMASFESYVVLIPKLCLQTILVLAI